MHDNRETIRNIKREFRLYMNGITSAQMRKMGMNYNIIFGISIPHLKEIAAKFPKEKELAHDLWKENIRESKLLAIYLLPEEEYYTVADSWVTGCRYCENADHLAHTILQRLPDATAKALEWIENETELTRYCGFQTLSHLFRQDKNLTQEQEKAFFDAVAREKTATATRAFTSYCDRDEERFTRYSSMYSAGAQEDSGEE